MATRTTASKKKRVSAASKKPAVSKKKPSRKKTTAASSSPKVTRKKAATGRKKSVSKKKNSSSSRRSSANLVSGPQPGEVYTPRKGEQYMGKEQLEHFRQKLLAWKDEIQRDLMDTMNHLREDVTHLADPNDRATQESEFALELRTRDRERKLLRKIESALSRIDDGSYGYCEETGDEIGLARLEIRPVATLCVEAQERREQRERQFADNR